MYCKLGECKMFKDFSSSKCCMFCDRGGDCKGVCANLLNCSDVKECDEFIGEVVGC